MEDIELIIENKRKELDILEDEYYDIKNKKAVLFMEQLLKNCKNKLNVLIQFSFNR